MVIIIATRRGPDDEKMEITHKMVSRKKGPLYAGRIYYFLSLILFCAVNRPIFSDLSIRASRAWSRSVHLRYPLQISVEKMAGLAGPSRTVNTGHVVLHFSTEMAICKQLEMRTPFPGSSSSEDDSSH